MNISRKIPCGGFNLDDSLLLNDKNTLATAIGGSVDSEPFNVVTVVDGLIINEAITKLPIDKYPLDLREVVNPIETLSPVVIEYEVEYGEFKASKVELVQGFGPMVFYSIGGVNFSQFTDDGPTSLIGKSIPFIIIQNFNSITGALTQDTRFFVLSNCLGRTLTIRRKMYGVNPIGMSFTTTPSVLFRVSDLTSNASLKCNIKPKDLHTTLSLIIEPFDSKYIYNPVFSLYVESRNKLINSIGWSYSKSADTFTIGFNGTDATIILDANEMELFAPIQ